MDIFKKLNCNDRKHLREAAHVTSLEGFKVMAEHQLKMRQDQMDAMGKVFVEPCHTCKSIARKLGLPIEPDKES